MKRAIVLDTETSGLPLWDQPSEAEGQPHLAQLAVILYDFESDRPLNRFVLTTKPDGWVSDEKAQAVHGIDPTLAREYGVGEDFIVESFLRTAGVFSGDEKVGMLYEPRYPVIGFSTSFDMRILRIAICRFFNKELAGQVKTQTEVIDTMKMAKDHLGVGRIKLVEAYEQIVGEQMTNSHDAMADTVAALRIYKALSPYRGAGQGDLSQDDSVDI